MMVNKVILVTKENQVDLANLDYLEMMEQMLVKCLYFSKGVL